MIKKRDYISASQISTFLTCPLLYKKNYINGEESKTKIGEYMVYGTAIHAVLEKNFKQKIKSRIDLTTEELVEYWHKIFKELLDKENKRFSEENVETLKKAGEKMIKLYMKDIAPTTQPLAAEQRFEIVSEKYGIVIVGYIDLITEDGFVDDFKTIGESSVKTYTQKYVDNMLQLTMYSIAYRKMYGKTEKGMRIQALKRLKAGPKIDIIETTRTNRQIEQLGQLMKQMRKLIDLGLFYPNLNSCNGCGYEKTCDKLCLDDEIVEKEEDTLIIDLDISLD